MRRIPIRVKLALALAPSMALLVAVVGLKAVDSSRQAADVRRQVEFTAAAVGPSGLFTSLQDERNRAALDLLDVPPDVIRTACGDGQACRAATDESLEHFSALVSGHDEGVRDAYAPATDALAELDLLRFDVDDMERTATVPDARTFSAEVAFARYSELIDALLTANAQVTEKIDDPLLRQGAELTFIASRQSNLIAHLVRNTLLIGVSEGGLDTREEIAQFGSLSHLARTGEEEIRDLATGDYARVVERVQDARVTFYEELARIAETSQVDVEAFVELVGQAPGYSGPFRDEVTAILDPKADALVDAANRRMWLFWGVAVITLVGAGLATWLVSLSITRPLSSLARQAREMAKRRLPDAVSGILAMPPGEDVVVPDLRPIQAQTHDEVADVVVALNKAQDSAVGLALEQVVLRRNIADAFLNLGRRNQSLLGRQLDFITELEHSETDPDTLANLYRLDHLATRMRRNAESLLVLAGTDGLRRMSGPVRITDAVRAAVSEVEDYRRVTIGAIESASIVGSAVADVIHLLAELLENALVFSPPHEIVEIVGRNQPAGAPRRRSLRDPPGIGSEDLVTEPSYTLAIIDSGLGMPPNELASANRRLAGGESFTVAPSKYLGHYVAGNLAARHGISVTLHGSPGHAPGTSRGITATVDLPAEVLTPEGRHQPEPWALSTRTQPAPTTPARIALESRPGPPT